MKIRIIGATLFLSTFMAAAGVYAADWREEAGVGIGVTAGNMWVIPIKAILTVMAVPQSALAFVTSGGDTEVAGQILRNGTEGPYLITPSLARTGIGSRPELEARSAVAREP